MNIMDVGMKTNEDNLRVLGLDLNANSDDIKDAWRTMLKVWHPDRFHGDETMRRKAEQRTKEINAAYQALEGYNYSPPRPAPQHPPEPRPQPAPTETKPQLPPKHPLRSALKTVGFLVATTVIVIWAALYGHLSKDTHFRGPDDHPATSAQISQVKIFDGSLSPMPEPVTGGPENNKLSTGYEFDGHIQNNLTVEISFIRMKITIFDCPEVPVSDTYDPSPPSDCKSIGDDEEDDFPHAEPGESVGFSNFHFSQRPLSSLRWNYEITEMDTEKASSPGPAPNTEDVYYREQPWPGASKDYVFPDGSIITTPAGYALINDDDGTPAQFNKDGFIYVSQSKFVVTVKNHVGKEVTSTGACVAWSGNCGIVQPTHSSVQ